MSPLHFQIIRIKSSAFFNTILSLSWSLVKTDGTAATALGKFPIATGGKTGTALFNTVDLMGKIGRGDYAWYVGYAPADKPEIAISIVINEKHLIS